MNWLRNLLGKKEKKASTRAYAGATHSRLTSDWIASSSSQDSELLTSLRPLRNRSRQLCRDNDYARGAVRTIVNNIVGKGMTLQAQVKRKRGDRLDENINSAIEDLWADWSSAKYCHTAGKLGFSDIERLVMRSIIESGEVLIRLVPRSFAGSPVPLALEVIEADQLVDEYTAGRGEYGLIRMGVEVDEWQRAIAYWLYPHHPGDYQFTSSSVGSRLLRVGASEILHLHLSDRPGQTRGVPWFHSALLRLRNVGGYEEAELVAARAQASVMGFIQSPEGELFGDSVDGSQRLTSLEPGAIEMLAPGETFAGFAPTRPNMGFDPFVRMMLRGVATGIGMSYEALSRDYSNTSYSSARTALLDERDNYRVVQDWLIKNFHLPIYLQWLDLAVLSGAIALPGYELNPRFYQKSRWVARGWQWVDPQNEVAAYKEAIKAGFTTTSQVVAQSGLDIEDVLKERRRELDLAEELDISFDTTLADAASAPDGEQQQPQTEEPEVKENFTPVRTLKDDLYNAWVKILEEKIGQGDFQKSQSEEDTETTEQYLIKEGFTPVRSQGDSAEPSAFQVRAKNCKKGISCGNTCIAATKTCKKTLSPPQAKKKQPAKKSALPTQNSVAPQKAPSIYDPNDKTKVHADFHSLYDLASGDKTPDQILIPTKDLAEAKKVTGANKWFQQTAIKLIQDENPDITKEEAAALADWGGAGYGDMNKRIYAPGLIPTSKQQVLLTVDLLAAKALYKLPAVTTEQIKKYAQFDPNKPLDRYVNIKGVKKYVQQFEDALRSNTPHLEQTFFATTHISKNEIPTFSDKANIKFVVHAKMDGTGKGRYIEPLKDGMMPEGEVLYPPMTKFQVKKVEQKKDYTPIEKKALADYPMITIAKELSQNLNEGKPWQHYYEKDISKGKAPDDATVQKLEKAYNVASNKPKPDFVGYVIELEEL